MRLIETGFAAFQILQASLYRDELMLDRAHADARHWCLRAVWTSSVFLTKKPERLCDENTLNSLK
jgi:hypothetical protein